MKERMQPFKAWAVLDGEANLDPYAFADRTLPIFEKRREAIDNAKGLGPEWYVVRVTITQDR